MSLLVRPPPPVGLGVVVPTALKGSYMSREAMRILVIAPEQSNLHTFPEVRVITASNYVNLLIEDVTKQAIYEAVRTQQYDIIHFATHAIEQNDGTVDCLQLSSPVRAFKPSDPVIEQQPAHGNYECLTQEEVAQVCRAAGARLVFFNACNTAGMAAYVVRHGTPYAIYTTKRLPDNLAWMMPATFYSRLAAMQATMQPTPIAAAITILGVNFVAKPFAHSGGVLSGPNYPGIFVHADTGEGVYGLAIDPEQIETAQTVAGQVGQLVDKVDSLRTQIFLLAGLQGVSILSVLYLYFRSMHGY